MDCSDFNLCDENSKNEEKSQVAEFNDLSKVKSIEHY